MNRITVFFKTVFAVLSMFLFLTSNSYADWHTITQSARNQGILIQAQHDLGLVGGSCKIWAYDVVRVASNSAGGPTVYLPQTSDYLGESQAGYTWVNDGGYAVSSGALAPSAMVPGMIIQMRLHYLNGTYGPHTAIVLSNSVASQQITFIESNYNGDYTVKTRTVTYSQFLSSIEPTSHYTVYTIH